MHYYYIIPLIFYDTQLDSVVLRTSLHGPIYYKRELRINNGNPQLLHNSPGQQIILYQQQQYAGNSNHTQPQAQ